MYDKKKNFKGNKKNFKKSTMANNINYGLKLPFSDDPTLLNIANMNEGRVGYDISVNGFTTTQGNRTFALISVPQMPHNINIEKGLPVYMGAKAVSEVEYPTLDSNLTPNSSGVVTTDSVQIGRLNTLGYYDTKASYLYQGLALLTGRVNNKENVIGLMGMSLTAKSE